MVVGVDVPLKHLQHSRLVDNNMYMVEIAFPILPIALFMQEIV
jgi:predicted nuclease with RNAse H fold